MGNHIVIPLYPLIHVNPDLGLEGQINVDAGPKFDEAKILPLLKRIPSNSIVANASGQCARHLTH